MDASRIRQYVDGELAAEAAAEFGRALQEDDSLRKQVSFEHGLRERVGRVMCETPGAPRPLVDALRSVRQAESASEMATDAAAAEAQPGPSRSAQLFRGPTRMNIFAVAACLAIVAGAVLFGIFGEPFLRQRLYMGDAIAALQRATTEASAEHERCALGPSAKDEKIHYRTPGEIRANLDDRLGRPVPVFDLASAGYTLVGGGECTLYPSADRSVHLMYRRAGGGPQHVSIFMQPDQGQFPGVRIRQFEYRAQDLGLEELGCDPSMWTDGKTIFIVVACTREDHARAMSLIRSIASLD